MVLGVKQKAGENLDNETVTKVIELLEGSSPITKKQACEMLNISYNTTRLNKIVVGFKDKIDRISKQKALLRSIPVSKEEIKSFITDYLEGDSISSISESSYRSIATIKNVFRKYDIPLRTNAEDNIFLPDSSIKEDYEPGDLVYSAKYNAPAVIRRFCQNSKQHGKVYWLWVFGTSQQFCAQPYYELGDLTPVQKAFNIKLNSAEGVQPADKLTRK